MQALYDAIADLARSGFLPGMFEHSFMIRGMLAALLIGPVLGAMGTVVVTKKLSFFTQTIGHASLTGVAIGLYFGEPMDATFGGLYGFCLIVALVMNFVKNRTGAANDTVIGVVLAQILGLGIVMMVVVTKQFNIHQVEAILFGSLITLTEGDLLMLLISSIFAVVMLMFIFNQTILISFNPVMAKARGLRIVVLEYLFIMVLTAVVVASLKLIGALLVLVLVVVPAAGAQNIARNLKQFFWISIAFSSVSTVAGLMISGAYPIPTGGSIVLVSSILFYGTLLLRPLFGGRSISQGSA